MGWNSVSGWRSERDNNTGRVFRWLEANVQHKRMQGYPQIIPKFTKNSREYSEQHEETSVLR